MPGQRESLGGPLPFLFCAGPGTYSKPVEPFHDTRKKKANMTQRRLPGIESLGISYDVNGYYADVRSLQVLEPLFTFQFANYNPGAGGESSVLEVYGTLFYYPPVISAVTVEVSEVATGTTFSVTDRQVQVNTSGEVEGWYEGFKGSVTASFDQSYRTSASFYMLTQMGINQAYTMSLPTPSILAANYLTPEAQKDINDESTSPATLVARYGAFFLHGGIWGGTLNYSQSISVYSVDTETKASAAISANYMNFISATVRTGVQVDNIASTTQSDGHFECKGGNPSQLTQGWQAWSQDLTANGSYVLVNFDSRSLMPISVLASAKSRQQEIADYIRGLSNGPMAYLTSFKRSGTQVGTVTNGKSSTTPQITLKVASTTQLIVGISMAATKSKVTRLAFKVLDLTDNSLDWLTSDGSIYNVSNYQRTVDLTVPDSSGNTPGRAVAATGCGFTVTDGKVSDMVVYYQNLVPADTSAKPSFLEATVNYVHSGDKNHTSNKTEVSFQPGDGNRAVLTGLALKCDSDNMDFMEIWQDNLVAVQVSAQHAAQEEAAHHG